MPIAPKRSREVFQNLERDLVKLASKPQAKTVHRFRTGTRRLQILLSELSPKLDRSDKKLLKQLGRIRKRAGKVRDLDMQAAALRSLKVPREPRRKSQLVSHLIELRSQQEKKLASSSTKLPSAKFASASNVPPSISIPRPVATPWPLPAPCSIPCIEPAPLLLRPFCTNIAFSASARATPPNSPSRLPSPSASSPR